MKYETIKVQGTDYDLKNELNNNKKYQNYRLVSSQTYKTSKGILYTTAMLECPEQKEAICCVERATPILKFAEHFQKLNDEEFTTIRDHDKNIIVGDVVDIIAPEGRRFKAICTLVEFVKLDHCDEYFLSDDLCLPHTEDSETILKEFRKFYKDLDWDSLVYVYTLQKGVKKYENRIIQP